MSVVWGEKINALLGAVLDGIAVLNTTELCAATFQCNMNGLHLVRRSQLGLPAFVQRWLSAHWTFREQDSPTLEADTLEE